MNKIEILAKIAGKEAFPACDITERIMAEINAQKDTTVSFAVFDLFACISAVAAVAAIFAGISAWAYITDPAITILAPLREVPLW